MALRKEIEIPEELFNMAHDEFECNWASRKVVIKRFLYGDQLQIQQETMKVKGTSPTNMSAEVNIGDLQALNLLRAIVEAPWQVNDINAIRQLPTPVADWLKDQVDEFNTITIKKKEN